MSSFSASLASAERDTLGLDAAAPRRLHAPVLGAAERALARALDALGARADAPRPSGAGGAAPARPAPAPLRLAVARAAVEDIAPSAPPAAAAADAAAADAAEAAWGARAGGAA